MPAGLKRYQQSLQLHYVAFNCHQQAPLLATSAARELVERTLERVRSWYGFYVNAYVVMPDHVHVLMSEPDRASLAAAIQMWKLIVSRREHGQHSPIAAAGKQQAMPFWQARCYYDFNVWSERKLYEKMNYIHQKPVRRGLVARAEDWKWSSFRHIASGEDGIVEVEQVGMTPHIKKHVEQPVPPFAGRQHE
jgi:putative transposase